MYSSDRFISGIDCKWWYVTVLQTGKLCSFGACHMFSLDWYCNVLLTYFKLHGFSLGLAISVFPFCRAENSDFFFLMPWKPFECFVLQNVIQNIVTVKWLGKLATKSILIFIWPLCNSCYGLDGLIDVSYVYI